MQITNASGDMGLDASAMMRRIGEKSRDEQVKEAAQQFETIFIRQYLSETMKNMGKSMLGGDEMPGGQYYQQMMVDTLADSIESGGGIGLTSVIQAQLQQNLGGKAATNANNVSK